MRRQILPCCFSLIPRLRAANTKLAAEVGCHHDRSAAEEGKGAFGHEAPSFGEQPGQAGGLLLLEKVQRIPTGSRQRHHSHA